jgi:hypothetical protein
MDFVYYQAPKNVSTGRRKDEDNGDSSIPQAEVDGKPSSATQSAEKRTDPITSSAEENEEPEVSTRPRLTREQVLLLEQQFQAAPKPSSSTKRKLAETTGLSMPRVGVSIGDPLTPTLISANITVELVPKSSGESKTTKEASRG